MAQITEKMKAATKDTLSVVMAEAGAGDQKEIRAWLDTVNTAEEFFGNNREGLREYNNFIKGREEEHNRAVRNSRHARV